MMERPTWTDPDKRKWFVDHGFDPDNIRAINQLAQDGTVDVIPWEGTVRTVKALYAWPACKLCAEV